MDRGRYIVLEGGLGAGKTTQAEILISKLESLGKSSIYLSEPGGTIFAQNINDLIRKKIKRTAKANVLAFNAARADTAAEVEEALHEGKWVVADRSYLSTLAYQGYGEGQDIEQIRSICEYALDETQPDLVAVLNVSAETAAARLQSDSDEGYFQDMNSQFHDRVRDGYLREAKLAGFPVIDSEGTPEEVARQVWDQLEPLLDSKYETKKNLQEKKTSNVEDYVTNATGNVYAFNKELDSATVAAAMARLSRRGDDMRVILADEFIGKKGKETDLLARIISAYGDDSVQQLAGIHLVVEKASNLLTKKLEWGRLAAYLEQSTRYIYYDKKDKNGKFRYYTPSSLKASTREQYEKSLNLIFETYSRIVHNLTDYIEKNSSADTAERDAAWKSACRAQACDAARAILPAATTSTVGIFASGQAVENLYMHLMSEDNEEAREVGVEILAESRKVLEVFLERGDRPERGGAKIAYISSTNADVKELAEDNLPPHSADFQPATLIDVSMRNELDLVPYMLYSKSSLSMPELQAEVEKWPIGRKIDAFERYIGERLNRRHKPGRALEHVHYTWDLLCDYGIFRDLQRHRMVDGLEWQDLTPRYGFDIPKIVEDAGLDEMFEKCFDLSVVLYNTLLEHGFAEEAQYATLLGHRMRWKVTYNARQAFHMHELRTSPQGHPGYRQLVNSMHERISEVHPNLAKAMRFVNRDEDPELTRLAAERYAEFKLNRKNP